MDIKIALAHVVDRIDLSLLQMQDVMRDIMTGQCTDAQIAVMWWILWVPEETGPICSMSPPPPQW